MGKDGARRDRTREDEGGLDGIGWDRSEFKIIKKEKSVNIINNRSG